MKDFFKNLSIRAKLILSFFVVIALFVAIAIYQIINLDRIRELQDAGNKRAEDAIFISKEGNLGDHTYRIIADAIINRDKEVTKFKWLKIKEENKQAFNQLRKIMDTEQEKKWLNESEKNYEMLENIFETELMPLIFSQTADSLQSQKMAQIRQIDVKIDDIVDDIQNPLFSILESLNKESEDADMLFDNSIADIESLTLTVVIIVVVLSIILVAILSNAITKPVNRLKKLILQLSEGNLSESIEISSKDEIGEMAAALDDMIFNLKEIVSGITTGAENISSASQQQSETSEQVSQGASEQASSVEQISTSIEQMTANIQQNTDNARQAEKIAVKAAHDITDGANAVNTTVKAMKNIADKIRIIEEIAGKTDLLAINAAVEAARAGEHGKGFAVVASEVRKLAERSQNAAREITELSGSSVDTAEESGKKLNDIVPQIQNTSKLVQEISASSVEQSSGAGQINESIQQLTQITQQNAAASEEMATGSEELSNQALRLKDTVSFFVIEEKIKRKSHFKNKSNDSSSYSSAKKQNRTSSGEETKKEHLTTDDNKGFDIDMKQIDDEDKDFENY